MAKKKDKQVNDLDLARELGLVFQGLAGQHLTGVPARNIAPDEMAHLSDEQLVACLESGLYVVSQA